MDSSDRDLFPVNSLFCCMGVLRTRDPCRLHARRKKFPVHFPVIGILVLWEAAWASCGLGIIFYLVSICSRKSSARGSLLKPSQRIASLRTTGFLLVFATLISSGTPSSLGICDKANTAFFFTSVSGSFWMASVIC